MFNNLKHIALAGSLVALTLATPALAKPGGGGGNNGGGNDVTLLNANCNLATGCKFSGNIHDSASAALTQAAYNTTHNPTFTPISLHYLGASNDPFGTVTGGPTGTWSANGFAIDYIAVKSGPAFMLYSVTAGNFDYSTAGLQNGNNTDNPGLSHLAFFGSAVMQGVPEPAAWALLIGGFGFVGFSARRRQAFKTTFA